LTKVSSPNTKRRGRTIKLERDRADGSRLEITSQKTKIILPQRTSILIGKRLTKESSTMWLKNERRRNAAPIAAWTTTPGENAVSQS